MRRADYTDPAGDELAFDARQRAKANNWERVLKDG
jgi:hypothetical protein